MGDGFRWSEGHGADIYFFPPEEMMDLIMDIDIFPSEVQKVLVFFNDYHVSDLVVDKDSTYRIELPREKIKRDRPNVIRFTVSDTLSPRGGDPRAWGIGVKKLMFHRPA